MLPITVGVERQIYRSAPGHPYPRLQDSNTKRDAIRAKAMNYCQFFIFKESFEIKIGY
jgi:hypothetical protein